MNEQHEQVPFRTPFLPYYRVDSRRKVVHCTYKAVSPIRSKKSLQFGPLEKITPIRSSRKNHSNSVLSKKSPQFGPLEKITPIRSSRKNHSNKDYQCAQDFLAQKIVSFDSVCIFHSPMALSVSPRYPSQYLYSIHICACDL